MRALGVHVALDRAAGESHRDLDAPARRFLTAGPSQPRRDDTVEAITLERAAELLAERRAKGPAKKTAKKPAKKTTKKAAAKKTAKKTTKKAAKKA